MSNEREKVRMQHRGRGPMGRGMQPGEKPKDLKGSLGKLLSYIGNFKAAIIVVMIFAAASTVFNVIGCKFPHFLTLQHFLLLPLFFRY